MFWKIYFLYNFWCAQSCSFWAVFGLPIRIAVSAIQRRAEQNVHLCILGPKLLQWNFSKSLSYLYEVVHTNFFRRFLDSSQFLTTISRILWRHLTTKIRTCSDPFWKKMSKTASKLMTINGDAMVVWTMHPVERTTCRIGAWQKKHTYTTFSHLQPARVVRSPQTSHGDRVRRAHPRRCQPFIDPIHGFSLGGKMLIFDQWVNLNTASLRPAGKWTWVSSNSLYDSTLSDFYLSLN